MAYSNYQNYDYLQGTSQAAPMVSGLAGLILSVRPQSTPALVQSIIEGTSVDLGTTGWDQYFGHGRIDANAAVRMAQQQDFLGPWTGVGVYYQNSDTGGWSKLADECQMLTTGDMNGDGRPDLVGTQSGVGVYYRNSVSGAWSKLSQESQMITCGDIDGDGYAELIGVYPSPSGVWGRFTKTGWARITTDIPDAMDAGMMR